MTTDRTAAPPRSTALAERPAGRTQAPPSDAFSALLGAAGPKSDAPVRQHERPARRDDAPRPDDAPRDEASRPASEPVPATPPAAEEPVAAPGTPAPELPALFTLTLASPLPAAVVTPVEAAPHPPSLIPASVAAVTAVVPTVSTELAGAVAASVAATEEPELPVAIPAALVADEAQVELPENPVKPQLPGAVPASAVKAAPVPEGGAHAQTGGQPQPDAQRQPAAQPAPAMPAPTAAPAATAASAAPLASTEPAVEPQPAAAQSQTPAAATSPATQPPRIERAVPLSRALPTTGVVIQLASERGISHARLNLKPAELGGIEVKLHSTPAGIHAQLVADSPEAARMLSQAGEDLRRQLEERNVNLLSLDVSTSGEQREEQAGFADALGGDDRRPTGVPGTEHSVLMETPAAADTVLVLPDGVHVDVLA